MRANRMPRKIMVFTGARAEYGLLRPLMKEIQNDRELHLQVVVGGMHLERRFGATWQEIKRDGFLISDKVRGASNRDDLVGTAESISHGISGCARVFEKRRPDLVVVLGDRFETFAAATAASVLAIPIAHLHGGEATFGMLDETFRHAITKMSFLHFTATDAYRRRVIQLGEHPRRVFHVGAIGLDSLCDFKPLTRPAIEKKLGICFGKKTVLVAFHPVTLEKDKGLASFKALLEVLDKKKETHVIFTTPNADAGGLAIEKAMRLFAKRQAHRAWVFEHLGREMMFHLMHHVDAMMGNSSSAILEAPSFKTPTLNIGDRQKGRIKAKNIVDCPGTVAGIGRGMSKLEKASFRGRLRGMTNPYQKYRDGKAAFRVKDVLKRVCLSEEKKMKEFYDL